jgi:hypothetical protein
MATNPPMPSPDGEPVQPAQAPPEIVPPTPDVDVPDPHPDSPPGPTPPPPD